MLLGVFPSAIGRVRKPYCRSSRIARWSVVANVSPQTPCLGLARARRQHRYPRVVRMPLASCHHLTPQRFHQRVQQLTASSHPVRQGRSFQFDSVSLVPLRLMPTNRFRTAGRGEDDPHIWRSIHVPVDRVPPVHAQSAGSVPPLARSVRSVGSSASGAHDESPESIPGRTPTSPIHLRPTSATLRRSRDKPSVSVRAFAFGVADVPAADAAPVSRSQPAEKLLQDKSRWFARRLAPVANLPTAVPVVRSAAPASLTCARTASAAAG